MRNPHRHPDQASAPFSPNAARFRVYKHEQHGDTTVQPQSGEDTTHTFATLWHQSHIPKW